MDESLKKILLGVCEVITKVLNEENDNGISAITDNAKLDYLKSTPLPEKVERFVCGIGSFLDANGHLSENQKISLNSTYLQWKA